MASHCGEPQHNGLPRGPVAPLVHDVAHATPWEEGMPPPAGRALKTVRSQDEVHEPHEGGLPGTVAADEQVRSAGRAKVEAFVRERPAGRPDANHANPFQLVQRVQLPVGRQRRGARALQAHRLVARPCRFIADCQRGVLTCHSGKCTHPSLGMVPSNQYLNEERAPCSSMILTANS